MKNITKNIFFKNSIQNTFKSITSLSNNSFYSLSSLNFNTRNRNNVDDMIDNMLKTKGKDNTQTYQRNNFNNDSNQNQSQTTTPFGQNNNQGGYNQNYRQNQNYNSNSNNNNQVDGKFRRNKVSFLRDGMLISFSLTRNFVDLQNRRKDGYIYIELKEFVEAAKEDELGAKKDERFVILSAAPLGKLLLLHPKSKADVNNLEHVEVNHKYREISVHQTPENKYIFKVAVASKEVIDTTKQDENAKVEKNLTSQIELNAEDIVFLQLFVKGAIEQLAGF